MVLLEQFRRVAWAAILDNNKTEKLWLKYSAVGREAEVGDIPRRVADEAIRLKD